MSAPEALPPGRPDVLAPPGEVPDWRLALVWEAAWTSGLLDGLPGTPERIARRIGLEASAVRAIVSMLTAWQVLEADAGGRAAPGPRFPGPARARELAGHGHWIRMWAARLRPRLHDPTALGAPPEPIPAAERLRRLAAARADTVEPVVEACLRAAPERPRVLDLGGGHGEHSLAFAARGLATSMQDLPGVVGPLRSDSRFRSVELIAADAREHIAEGPFELILCANLANLFRPATAARLVRRACARLAPGGAIVLVAPMRDRGPAGAVFEVQMLVTGPAGAAAHAATEQLAWLEAAGCTGLRVEELSGTPMSLVAGRAPGPE
ncbi:MAG: class I SAM-dependent methyltransferase [Pseudoclavibacter sp.]|nr:class I SAM-dependent methyltransferase [Pseudoclavibacter sp.]